MSKDSQFHQKYENIVTKIMNNPGMMPARYVFILTNKCNLRCDFCFQYKNKVSEPMRTDDWLKVIDQIPDYGRVTLTGGEPFIFKEFKKVFAYAAQRLDVNIITNGLLLNEELIDFLLQHELFRVLSISIDDIGNVVRDVKPEQWNHLVKMLNLFQQKKHQLGHDCILDIKTMVLDENASELFNIHKFVTEELKAETHVFQFLKGSPIQHSDQAYPLEAILKAPETPLYADFDLIRNQITAAFEYNKNSDTSLFIHPKVTDFLNKNSINQFELLNQKTHNPENYKKCPYIGTSIHIDSDGQVFPCLSVNMGNVKNSSVQEIVQGPDFENFRELIRQNGSVPACSRCGWLKTATSEAD